jgi:hypothetical protein
MSTSSELFAIAAHLHVLLRRKTGRVTDTEWLASNPEYAREIVRFTREKARAEGHAELLPWADKLEAAIVGMGATPRRTLLEVASDALKAVPPPTTAAPSPGAPAGDDRYIGGLR